MKQTIFVLILLPVEVWHCSTVELADHWRLLRTMCLSTHWSCNGTLRSLLLRGWVAAVPKRFHFFFHFPLFSGCRINTQKNSVLGKQCCVLNLKSSSKEARREDRPRERKGKEGKRREMSRRQYFTQVIHFFLNDSLLFVCFRSFYLTFPRFAMYEQEVKWDWGAVDSFDEFGPYI